MHDFRIFFEYFGNFHEFCNDATICYMQLNMSVKQRIQFIDFVKAIALTLVILNHSNDSSLMSWTFLFFIPIFFICGGYTSTEVNLKGKYTKLIVPYFVINLVLFSVFCLLKKASFINFVGIFYSRFCLFPFNNPESQNIFFLDIMNGPTWFMTAMFTSYVIYKLISIIQSGVLRFISAITGLGISYSLTYLPILLPWSFDTCFIFAFFMYVGNLARKYKLILKWYMLIIYIALYISIYQEDILLNYSVRIIGTNFSEYIKIIIGGCVGSFMILSIAKYLWSYKIKAIDYISKNALFIFSFQLVFISIGAKIGMVVNLSDIASSFLELILSLIGGIFIGEIYQLIKKIVMDKCSFIIDHHL